MLSPLLRLAILPEEDRLERAHYLAEFARAAHAGAALEACGTALTEAVGLLEQARVEPTADRESIAFGAFQLGRAAESLGCPALARQSYLITTELLGTDQDRIALGVVWHDIGDTWRAEGNGGEAIRSYRTAAAAKTGEGDLGTCVVSLAALAEAEATWGTAIGCDEALAEAVRLLDLAVIKSDADRRGAASIAHQTGEAAEALERAHLARRAYLVALALLEPLGESHQLGMVLRDIGDTWRNEDNGDEALAHYRAAAEHLRGGDEGDLGFETLATLADAEASWGTIEACDRALAEALQVLQGAAGDAERAEISVRADELADLAESLGRSEPAAEARRLAHTPLEAPSPTSPAEGRP